jgi:hypothetical protein
MRHSKILRGDHCFCNSCGLYFNSTSAFDRHRTGPYVPITQPAERRCLTVEEMSAKGMVLNSSGFYIRNRKPIPDVRSDSNG